MDRQTKPAAGSNRQAGREKYARVHDNAERGVRFSVLVLADPDDPDRQWFAAHPRRTHRLRAAMPHDAVLGDGFTHVLVRQLAPGRRIRLPVIFTGPRPRGLEHDDDWLLVTFERVFRGGVA
jgi:hypothetical protein